MADLVVIVPSRDRPQAAHELVKAFDETCALDTQIVFAIDKRDVEGIYEYPNYARAITRWSESSTMVEALNIQSGELVASEMEFVAPPFAIGFMGDDHRPRTAGWDKEYLDALRELGTGIVYGDDLYQGEKLPTQCAMTADIVRSLGYMAPPSLRHMYVDNFWLDLGRNADCLYYLPDVVIEHMHPIADKGEWDEGYERVNAREVYDNDAAAYEAYGRNQFATDLAKVRALRGGA